MPFGLLEYNRQFYIPVKFIPQILCEDQDEARDEIVRYNMLHAGKEGPVKFGVLQDVEVVPCVPFLAFLKFVCCGVRHQRDRTQQYARDLEESLKKHQSVCTKRLESRRLRSKIAADQGWECTICNKRLPANYEVDHIHELHLGGTDTPDNLQALCPACHRQKTFDVQYEKDIERLFGIIIPETNPFQRFQHNPNEVQTVTLDNFLKHDTGVIIANLRRENEVLKKKLRESNNHV